MPGRSRTGNKRILSSSCLPIAPQAYEGDNRSRTYIRLGYEPSALPLSYVTVILHALCTSNTSIVYASCVRPESNRQQPGFEAGASANCATDACDVLGRTQTCSRPVRSRMLCSIELRRQKVPAGFEPAPLGLQPRIFPLDQGTVYRGTDSNRHLPDLESGALLPLSHRGLYARQDSNPDLDFRRVLF